MLYTLYRLNPNMNTIAHIVPLYYPDSNPYKTINRNRSPNDLQKINSSSDACVARLLVVVLAVVGCLCLFVSCV